MWMQFFCFQIVVLTSAELEDSSVTGSLHCYVLYPAADVNSTTSSPVFNTGGRGFITKIEISKIDGE